MATLGTIGVVGAAVAATGITAVAYATREKRKAEELARQKAADEAEQPAKRHAPSAADKRWLAKCERTAISIEDASMFDLADPEGVGLKLLPQVQGKVWMGRRCPAGRSRTP